MILGDLYDILLCNLLFYLICVTLTFRTGQHPVVDVSGTGRPNVGSKETQYALSASYLVKNVTSLSNILFFRTYDKTVTISLWRCITFMEDYYACQISTCKSAVMYINCA